MIRKKHRKGCPTLADKGKRCRCAGSWEVRISTGYGRPPLIRTFPSEQEKVAREWAAVQETRKDAGQLVEQTPDMASVQVYGEQVTAWMRDGTVRTRGQEAYSLRTIQLYADNLRLHVYPVVGDVLLSKLTRRQVQGMVDRMVKSGKSAETIRNSVNPLNLVYRIAIRNEVVEHSPVDQYLETPVVKAPAKNVLEGPVLAHRMLGACKDVDRAYWGLAFFAGLRRGELIGLTWADLDLNSDVPVLSVNQAYDPYNLLMSTPKTAAGKRQVFLIPEAAKLLRKHALLTGRRKGLVFGVDGTKAVTPGVIRKRSILLWERAGLAPVTLRQARHCFATWTSRVSTDDMVRARIMGHTSTRVTDNRYVHEMDGQMHDLAQAFQQYVTGS